MSLCNSNEDGSLTDPGVDPWPRRRQGYKKRSLFLKITENQRNRISSNLKITEFTVYYFKISEKIKFSKIYVKKLDQILRLLVIFCKIWSFGLIKFKFHQIYLNSFKRVRSNLLFIPNSLFIRSVYRQNQPVFVGWDFTVHIFNQMNFGLFLPNSAGFFRKPTESEGTDF
jgi:hypothetical protein